MNYNFKKTNKKSGKLLGRKIQPIKVLCLNQLFEAAKIE